MRSSPVRPLLVRGTAALLLLGTLALCVTAQQPSMPEKLTCAPNRLTQLVIKTGGAQTRWKIFGGEVASFREYDADPSRIVLQVIGYKEGTAYCLAWSAKGDVPSDGALCVITVGTPAPVNGGPVDALTFSLTSAYKSETDPKKTEYLAYLTALCGGMGAKIDSTSTAGELFAAFSSALHAEGLGIPKGALPLVMRVAGDHLNKAIGLDPAAKFDKNAAKEAFSKLASSLKGVH
jgi:hypothetical protein